jgi:hypothetical protein
MSLDPRAWPRIVVFSLASVTAVGAASFAPAGEPGRRPVRTVIVRSARPCPAPRASATLGTFQPTPYIMVRGNNPLGGGYSPGGIYGDQTLALYGPISPFRVTTAPVLIYTRGYDGSIHVGEIPDFSTPNLPELSPVRYPTIANNYYAPRLDRRPPRNSSAINWIDQN